MPLVYTESEKGKKMLLVEGFVYYRDKVNNEKTYWKCKSSSNFCNSRVQTVNDEILKTVGAHNHSADAAQINASKIVNEMKNRSKNSFDTPHQIVSSSACNIPVEVGPKLPSVSSIKKTLRRSRNMESECKNTNLLSSKDLILPTSYTLTSKEENFLLYDSGVTDDERMLVFGTGANLSLLQTTHHWYMDGTFKTVPGIFYQLYTIHCVIKECTIVPTVFALLPNKKSSTYIKLFTELKKIEPRLNPFTVMMDFEKSMIKALETVFPNTSIRGIYYIYMKTYFLTIFNFFFFFFYI